MEIKDEERDGERGRYAELRDARICQNGAKGFNELQMMSLTMHFAIALLAYGNERG